MLPAEFLTQRLGLAVSRGKTAGSWVVSSYERYLRVQVGNPAATSDGATVQAARAPELRDGRLFIPASLIEKTFTIVVCPTPADRGYDLQTPGAVVSDVRAGSHSDYLRLVFDLSGPAPFWMSETPGELIVELPPPQSLVGASKELGLFSFDDPLCPKVTTKATETGWTRIAITHAGTRPAVTFTLGNPYRLVVDLPRDEPLETLTDPMEVTPPPEVVEPLPEIPPAVATPWQVRSFATPRGPVRVFVLTCTPTAVRPALAGDTIFQRSRTSAIASRAGAVAAVNGGYFDQSGPPVGMLVVDGEWIRHPVRRRAVLVLTTDGQATIVHPDLNAAVQVGGLGSFALCGLNTNHVMGDATILYTTRWGAILDGSRDKVRVVVSRAGQVLQVATRGEAVEIPPGGYVLSAVGKPAQRLAQATPGLTVTSRIGTTPPIANLRHALGAGPRLVRDGRIHITAGEEQFRADVRYRACARTAVGVMADGHVLIAAGECAAGNALTLSELASVMLKLGCRDAMALDGGGSTTVVARGKVLNRPTDGAERSVSSALLVVE